MIDLRVSTNINPSVIVNAGSKAEIVLATQIMKDTRPFVPALTNSLNNRTYMVGSTIIYPAPYARYLYYGKVMVDSVTGKGPMKIPDVGYRFHKGAKLVPTSRNLVFTTSVNAQATSHWIDVSKRHNLAKWKVVAAKAVANGL